MSQAVVRQYMQPNDVLRKNTLHTGILFSTVVQRLKDAGGIS
jgi:hypothetical protein